MPFFKWSRSIFAKFLLWVLVLYTVQAVVVGALILRGVQQDYDTAYQREMLHTAEAVARLIEYNLSHQNTFSKVEDLIASLQPLIPRSSVILCNAQGEVVHVFYGSEIDVGTLIDLTPVKDFIEGVPPPLKLSYLSKIRTSKIESRTFSAAQLKLRENSYFLLIVFPPENLFYLLSTEIENVSWSAVVSIVAVLLITGLLVAFIVAYFLTSRISALVNAVRAYARGESGMRAKLKGADEISELASSFNAMADEIETRVADIATQDRLRRELVAALSHDIGAPSSAILNSAEFLFEDLNQQAKGTQQEYLQSLMRNAQSLRILTSDLIEVARLGSLNLTIAADEIEVGAFLREMRAVLKPQAERAEVRLDIVHPETEEFIECDPVVLERVLSNLATNAIRHTPAAGQVWLRAVKKEDRLVFEVQDTGPGIAPDEQEAIFNRFYQGKDGGGGLSGLGLAIVKDLVQALGSEIHLASDVGKGSCFSFSFPLLQ